MLLVSVLMQIVSSAYMTSSMVAPGILCSGSVQCRFSCTSWNVAVITTRNKYGDSGHPCLIPVSCAFYLEVSPSISTLNLVSLYSSLIIRISLSSTPSLSNRSLTPA